MIFLIQYDPRTGQRPVYNTYPDTDRVKVQEERLALELKLLKEGVKHEVVTLMAVDEAQVRRTHRRYFPDQEALFAEAVAEARADYCAVSSASLVDTCSK